MLGGSLPYAGRPLVPRNYQGLITLCIAVEGAILLVNIVLLAVASRYPTSDAGAKLLFQGDCDYVRSRSTVAHLAINALATALLTSSNVAMQSLSAPTRADIDRAHARGQWLHIGIPSLRNLWHSDSLRRTAWLALLLTSLPLHLVYNAVFLQSLQAAAYNGLVVTQDFLHGAWGTELDSVGIAVLDGVPRPEAQKIQAEVSTYVNKTWDECQQLYTQPFVQDWSNLVMVTNVTTIKQSPIKDSVLASFWYTPRLTNLSNNFFFPQNDEYSDLAGYYPNSRISLGIGLPYLSTVDWNGYASEHNPVVKIEYCMVQPAPNICTIEVFEPFLIVVIGAIILKMLCLGCIVHGLPPRTPLVTFGDAVASFLNRPDPLTAGGRAINHEWVETWHDKIQREAQKHGRLFQPTSDVLQRWQQFAHTDQTKLKAPTWSWRKAPSQRHRFATGLVCVALVIVAAVFVYKASPSANNVTGQTYTPSLQQLGLGQAFPQDIITSTLTWTAWQCLLVANAPQLLLSFLYFGYNQSFTQMVIAAEACSFASKRQPLRVSQPRGQQRSSFWLGLPLVWSIPLAIMSALLHWALSQSLFTTLIRVFVPAQSPGPQPTMNAIAYSFPGAILLFALVGLIVCTIFLVAGIRKFPSGMPLLSSNSIAIAAACHGHDTSANEKGKVLSDQGVRTSIADGPLQYGVTAVTGEKQGVVGFSSQEVQPLEPGWIYGTRSTPPAGSTGSKSGALTSAERLLAHHDTATFHETDDTASESDVHGEVELTEMNTHLTTRGWGYNQYNRVPNERADNNV